MAERNELVEQHLDLVRKIAGSLLSLFPPSIEFDDLVQEGNLGLLRAAEMYDRARGVAFAAYAKRRVRGAILDSNRRRHYRNATHCPIEDAPEISEKPDVDQRIDEARLARTVNKVVEILPPRERGIIQRYYLAGHTSKEIAQEIGMLTPRVGELRRAAMGSLKRGLAAHGLKKVA
jgi:RNA polymerase sigma factor (sigma-70 family)